MMNNLWTKVGKTVQIFEQIVLNLVLKLIAIDNYRITFTNNWLDFAKFK